MINQLRPLKFLFILFLFTQQAILAQWVQTNGPQGGDFRELVKVGETLFLATSNGGVFRSENDGSSWSESNNGLPIDGNNQVLLLKEYSGFLYASISNNGIYKSEDAGQNWFPINNGIEFDSFFSFVFDGANIYASNQNGGISFSSDGGQNWVYRPDNISDQRFNSLAISGTMLYGSKNFLYESADNGLTWNMIDVPGLGVNFVPEILATPSAFYLINNNNVYYSTDNLTTWDSTDNNSNRSKTGLAEFGGSVYAITFNGTYFRTENDGNTWTEVTNSGTDCCGFIHLFVDDTRVFMTATEGVWSSNDDGVNWSLNNTGIGATSIISLYGNEQDVFASAPNLGVFRSGDEGDSWQWISDGLDEINSRVVRDIIQINDTLVLGTGAGIYVSSDNGDNWTRKLDPGANSATTDVAYDNGVLVTGPTLANFNISTDRGETWLSKPIDPSGTIIGIWGLVIEGNTIVAGASDGRIYRSFDLGDNWTEISIPGNLSSVLDLELVDGRLFLARGLGAYISDDLGDTWEPILDMNFTVFDIEVDGLSIYAGTTNGFYGTTIGRAEWAPIQEGMPLRNIQSIHITENYIYAGSSGTGVWRIPKSEAFIPPLDDDNDGVPNLEDLCPDTPAGKTVTANGCDFIANDAIRVYALSQSCTDSTDGIIEISMSETGYLLDIMIEGEGISDLFENISSEQVFRIDNLAVGSYEISITIPEILFETRYGVAITELTAVTGKRVQVQAAKGTVRYQVSGSKDYEVEFNGKLINFSFDGAEEHTIELHNLAPYNKVVIAGHSDCQGRVEDSFFIDEEITLHPTLVGNEMYFNVDDGQAEISIYDLSGKLVSSWQNIHLEDTENTLDVSLLKTGIYIVKVSLIGKDINKIIKIVKQ